jgi:hypothetical protein
VDAHRSRIAHTRLELNVDPLKKNRVEFLAEQDGPAERVIKQALSVVLDGDPDVAEAYLAQIGYDPSDARSVALCLVSQRPGARQLLLGIEAVARRQLAAGVHLDVLFLSAEQRADLKSVCAPFWIRAT